jgi:hypothetical protein
MKKKKEKSNKRLSIGIKEDKEKEYLLADRQHQKAAYKGLIQRKKSL